MKPGKAQNVLFVGMEPSRRGDPETPLLGAIGRRLSHLLQITPEIFAADYSRINLNRFPLPVFSQQEASRKVKSILRGRGGPKFHKLVLCGQVVSECFQLAYQPLYVSSCNGKLCLIFPHPSGLNRWWNDPFKVHQAGLTLRKFVYET